MNTSTRHATTGRWQDTFLTLLPAIRTHAAICFRRHPDREEAIAEATASAFISFGVLARQGKLAKAFAGSLARFAVGAVNRGRHVGGRQNSRDVMSPQAQKKRCFGVEQVSRWDDRNGAWREMSLESRRVSPADQACFNLDFQAWLAEWPPRDRRIINILAAGHGNREVASRFKVTHSRIFQLRRVYQRSWEQYQGVVLAA